MRNFESDLIAAFFSSAVGVSAMRRTNYGLVLSKVSMPKGWKWFDDDPKCYGKELPWRLYPF